MLNSIKGKVPNLSKALARRYIIGNKEMDPSFQILEGLEMTSLPNFDMHDEERLENTPSPFVADKSQGLFQKYSNGHPDSTTFVNLTLAERVPMTHDSYLFRFEFPKWDRNLCMGSNACGTVLFRVFMETPQNPDGEIVERYAYTCSPKYSN